MANQTTIFKNRSLLILGISESISNIGNWITIMAVFAMVVFKGEGGVIQSSGIFLAGLLPTLVFSPAAGWLCDRFDRKWLMIGSEVFAGISIAGLIFVHRLELIYGLLALQAIFTSIMGPARQASIPEIVSKDDLPRANAFLQQLNSIIKIMAPVLAGAILGIMNPHQAVILDVISFALSAIILSRLPAFPPHREQTPVQDGIGHAAPEPAMSTLQIMRKLPSLRLLFLATFLAITVIIGFDILAAVFTRDVLAENEQFFSLIISLVGIGTLAVTLWLIFKPSSRSPWYDLTLGLFLLSMISSSLAAASAIQDLNLARIVTLVGVLFGGVGNGLVVIQSATLLQRLSPPAFLGRMGGIYQSTAVAGQLLGMLLAPLVVPALLPIGLYFVVSSAALLLVVVYTGSNYRRIDNAAGLQAGGDD